MGGVNVGIALEAFDVNGLVILVLVLLCGNGELCDLCGRLVSDDGLALSLDVQDEGVRS